MLIALLLLKPNGQFASPVRLAEPSRLLLSRTCLLLNISQGLEGSAHGLQLPCSIDVSNCNDLQESVLHVCV